MKIDDFAEIIVGQIMTRVTTDNIEEGTTVQVLSPKAISDGVIDTGSVTTCVINKKIDKEKYIREGDVVIKLSTPYDAVYITSEMQGMVIPSFCAIIRVKNNVDAKYLAAFLNSVFVREQLTEKVSGGVKPMIKVTDIRSLEFPNISDEDMRKIGEAFILSGKKKAVLAEMIQTESKIMNTIVMNSIIGGMNNE